MTRPPLASSRGIGVSGSRTVHLIAAMVACSVFGGCGGDDDDDQAAAIGAVEAIPSGMSTQVPAPPPGDTTMPRDDPDDQANPSEPLGPPTTAGAAGAAGAMAVEPGSMTDAPPDNRHRCGWGQPADPRDALLTEDYQTWLGSRGQVDLFLPQAVLDWMTERLWDESHDLWHAVRQCSMPIGGSRICRDRPDLVATAQVCESARDGYEFLVMHHHMIVALREAFPTNPQLFEGFSTFPFESADLPEPLRGGFRGWSSSTTDTARVLDDIENNLDQFPTEGDLGLFMQCGVMRRGTSGIHGAMHFQWGEFASPRNLGDQTRNLGNYMFWKLHGWIDDVWLRYRAAKGLDDDPDDDLDAELEAQCWEMHDLGHVATERGVLTTSDGVELPFESGEFHDVIRPILDANCASCHSGGNPAAGLVLGGATTSAKLVASLVGRPTARGGDFVMVDPGSPARSWLYLRAADEAKDVTCDADCSVGVMPPTGQVTLTAAELTSLRGWIENGALAP